MNREHEKISLVKKWKYFIQNDEPPPVPRYQADYQPFGDLWLNFKNVGEVTNYTRELDLTNAIARTKYSRTGTDFVREYFASAPDEVIVIRLSSNKPGSISFECLLNSPHKSSSTKKSDGQSLAVSLKVRNGALRGEAILRLTNKHGTVVVQNDRIVVDKADEVTLFLVAATNYRNYKDVSGDPVAICRKAIDGIRSKNIEQVKSAHISEYLPIFQQSLH